MMLIGQQERHPAYKKRVVGCWHGYLSGARCNFAYGPADAIATHCLLLQSVINSCAQTLFALRIMRSHGMDDTALQMIYRSVVIAKLTYASSN